MKKIKKYFKMIFPRIGLFTNGPYVVKGVKVFGRIYGRIKESYYPMVHDIGSFVIFPEYHLEEDEDPQFLEMN